ncbi:MAG: DUF2628 domain-containing protein [Leptospirales bacterium]|nr:DUF2628 domain-containing protein [Leptospirales bacterium]
MLDSIYPLIMAAIAFLCFRAYFRIVRRDIADKPQQPNADTPFVIYASVFGLFWLGYHRLWRYASILVVFSVLTTAQTYFATFVLNYTFGYSPSSHVLQISQLLSFLAQGTYAGLIGAMLKNRGLVSDREDWVKQIGRSTRWFRICSYLILLTHFLILVLAVIAVTTNSAPSEPREIIMLVIAAGAFFPLAGFFFRSKKFFRYLVISLGALSLLQSFFTQNLTDWFTFVGWFLFSLLTFYAGSIPSSKGT